MMIGMVEAIHVSLLSVTEPVIVFVLHTATFALCVHVMNTIPS